MSCHFHALTAFSPDNCEVKFLAGWFILLIAKSLLHKQTEGKVLLWSCGFYLNYLIWQHCLLQKVYASPSRRRMDTKGEVEEMTYPHICFMVDNFDEVWLSFVFEFSFWKPKSKMVLPCCVTFLHVMILMCKFIFFIIFQESIIMEFYGLKCVVIKLFL